MLLYIHGNEQSFAICAAQSTSAMMKMKVKTSEKKKNIHEEINDNFQQRTMLWVNFAFSTLPR